MKSQQIEDPFDPVLLIDRFNKNGIKYLLIGRQAVIQYGAPLFSFDYDFWVNPPDKKLTCELIEAFGLVAKYSYGIDKPINEFSDDEGNKIDLFFLKGFDNIKRNINLSFKKVYSSSVIKKDPKSNFFIRIPSIKDLILLKQLGDMRPKDEEDIEYLESISLANV